MSVFFLTCLALGGAVLVIQLVLGMMGLDHGHAHDAGDAAHAKDALHATHHGTQGLNLMSARALSAGVAFFGVGGLAGLATGFGWPAGIFLGVIFGITSAVAVAAVMRTMLRMESDGTLSIHGAVGTTGIVYLSIPGGPSGAGKIHLTLQNRLVELQATSDRALPTGASVLVVDVVGPDTVSVVPNPIPDEVPDVVS